MIRLMGNNGSKESSLIKKLERQKILRNANRSAARPLTLGDISSVQVDGVLTYQAFIDNISAIFPLIIELVNEGNSIYQIEKTLGFNERVLHSFLQRFPSLGDKIKKARKLKTDSFAR